MQEIFTSVGYLIVDFGNLNTGFVSTLPELLLASEVQRMMVFSQIVGKLQEHHCTQHAHNQKV